MAQLFNDLYKSTRKFAKLESKEIQGPLKNGPFEMVDTNQIRERMRIFESRFMDIMIPSSVGARYGSRLMAHNHGGKEASWIATKSPVVSLFAQRLVLSIPTLHSHLQLYAKDITTTYN